MLGAPSRLCPLSGHPWPAGAIRRAFCAPLNPLIATNAGTQIVWRGGQWTAGPST
jgi:hypothetical protein